jgi:hypothetical protein
MNERLPGIFVACADRAVFVRVVGRGCCRNSEPLREFGHRKVREGCTVVYVDLQKCDGLDSTFLGVFAGLGLTLTDHGSLQIFNLSGENLKAFSCLGLEQIASVQSTSEGPIGISFPPDSGFELLPGSDTGSRERAFDALERAVLMLECHEDLCRIDERNEERFREVKRFLREDIVRHSSSGGEGAGSSGSLN